MRTIIWDWNGTLLDDLEVCIGVVNGMLERRGLPVITREIYQAKFGFPVKNFYKKIGFDVSNDSFEAMAVEYIQAYLSDLDQCGLQPFVKETLQQSIKEGYDNHVLSAMEQDTLERSVTSFDLTPYFTSLKGITDYHAKGKLDRGKELMQEHHIDPLQTTLVGDTTHDYEVASQLGCDCILVSNGHFSAKRLKSECQVQVVNNVREAIHVLLLT